MTTTTFLQDEEIDVIKENVKTVNQNKEPISFIQQYAVYEHLGSGAFGSVYKVIIYFQFQWPLPSLFMFYCNSVIVNVNFSTDGLIERE